MSIETKIQCNLFNCQFWLQEQLFAEIQPVFVYISPGVKVQAETGISAISVGPGVDMAQAKKAVGDKVCIMGNVDLINILLQSNTEKVYEESKRIMEIGKQNGGYLFNSGEMIPRAVPEENMRAFIKAGKEFGKY